MASSRVLGLVCVVVFAVGASAPRAGSRPGPAQQTTPSRSAGIAGRCHCGAVRYEARGPAVRCSFCDCRDCQRASGTLKSAYVTVERAGFKVVSGKPAAYRARAGEKCDRYGVWHFCGKCGAPLYWVSDNGKEVDIFAGSLDDPSIFRPSE